MAMKMITRVGLGVLTTTVILIALDALPSLVSGSLAQYRIFGIFYFWLAVESGFFMFLAAFGGAYIAKVRFVLPAVVLAAAGWLSVVYFANAIATVVGQGDVLAVAGSNILALIFGGFGAAAGAGLGQHLSTDSEGSAASTAR